MGILAFETISAETNFSPILAHLSLVFLCIVKGHHLSILYECHAIIFFFSSFWWLVELPCFVHRWDLSSGNESRTGRVVECKWVNISIYVVLPHDWWWSKGRNWCERRNVCVLGYKALRLGLHWELRAWRELCRHLSFEGVVTHVAMDLSICRQGIEIGGENAVDVWFENFLVSDHSFKLCCL